MTITRELLDKLILEAKESRSVGVVTNLVHVYNGGRKQKLWRGPKICLCSDRHPYSATISKIEGYIPL